MKKSIIFLGILSVSMSYAQQQDTSGKVGVNTETPTETFDVKGTAKIQELPKSGEGKVYNGTSGKNTTFTGTRTLVSDENGVLGFVEGLPGAGGKGYTAGQGISISDANVISRTGLEEVALEGENKKGWKLIGVNRNKVGADAVDVSTGNDDTGAVGDGSFAAGTSATASGKGSIAMGYQVYASEEYSVAMGKNSHATSHDAVAMGRNSTASGSGSVAIVGGEASGGYSIAIGHSTYATGEASIAIGGTASGSGSLSLLGNAMGESSLSLGQSSTASGVGSVAIMGEASGINSLALGYGSTASGEGSIAMGYFNSEAPDKNNLFMIGNGSYDGYVQSLSNAFIVRKDGKTGIGLVERIPTEMLEVNGAVKVGTTTNTCSNSNRGSIKYENDNFYGCKSTGWVLLNN